MSRICVVGMGYVGLPLAIAFSKKHVVIGLDKNSEKIGQLKKGIDPTNENKPEDLKYIEFTTDEKKISKSEFVIVAVPTPITKTHSPDLGYLKSASESIGRNILKGSVVVFESTVYPGVTEEICLKIIEEISGLKAGADFGIGYSPERINPGDKEHRIENIVKVVSGNNEETLSKIANLYSGIISKGVFKAKSIKVAESAKVIENIQRDLNIALVNELSIIFDKLGINTRDVLDAAETKWNFHKYSPGLVGGHCIGVDPYYLTYKASEVGYQPQVILAGRAINEYMPKHVVSLAVKALGENGIVLSKCRILILGLTFKENINDYRNSKARNVINEFKVLGAKVFGCDPNLDRSIIENHFGVTYANLDSLPDEIDCTLLITGHAEFKALGQDTFKKIMAEPVLLDVRSFYTKDQMEKQGIKYISL